MTAAMPTLEAALRATPGLRACDPTRIDPVDLTVEQAAAHPAVKLCLTQTVRNTPGEQLTTYCVADAVTLRDELALAHAVARLKREAESMILARFGVAGRVVWHKADEAEWMPEKAK